MAQILLLEPDKLLAQTYCRALEESGHKTVWQTDAQAALGVLDSQAIDLIILELQLPNHNGVELLHEVRSYPDWDNIPILLHTLVGVAHPGLGRPYWPQLGIVGYMYKPQTSLATLVQQADRQLALAANASTPAI